MNKKAAVVLAALSMAAFGAAAFAHFPPHTRSVRHE